MVTKLDQCRLEINEIDEQIVALLGRRFSICIDVADYKKENAIPMMQPARIEMVKARCRSIGEQKGVRPDFINELYDLIIGEACQLETRIIGE